MEISSIHAAWTVLLFIAFIGIVCWAYSSKRKSSFEEAAQIPLNDDEGGQGNG